MGGNDYDVVKLHGHWASPFSTRVLWALNLKKVPYEFIAEDLPNKSELLLQYNPVHKKIPVLVHGGKPICESMVIIEYIEETWPQSPSLLPKDPYERAIIRFWVHFVELKGPSIWMVFRTFGEEQEKAKKESVEMLRRIEEFCVEKINNNTNNKFFGGEEIGILDIALGGMIVEWQPTTKAMTTPPPTRLRVFDGASYTTGFWVDEASCFVFEVGARCSRHRI
uniref:Glutathione S-transferase n=1 Tax=Cannabis sativa TaxID=3483 RepID=A0A803Q4C7_CANSA